MAPKSRAALAAEVFRAMIGGTLVCFASAMVASILHDTNAVLDDVGAGHGLAACAATPQQPLYNHSIHG